MKTKCGLPHPQPALHAVCTQLADFLFGLQLQNGYELGGVAVGCRTVSNILLQGKDEGAQVSRSLSFFSYRKYSGIYTRPSVLSRRNRFRVRANYVSPIFELIQVRTTVSLQWLAAGHILSALRVEVRRSGNALQVLHSHRCGSIVGAIPPPVRCTGQVCYPVSV